MKIFQGLPSDFRIKSKYCICLNNLPLKKTFSSCLLFINLAPFSASSLLSSILTEGGDYGIPGFNIVIHWLPNSNVNRPWLQKTYTIDKQKLSLYVTIMMDVCDLNLLSK